MAADSGLQAHYRRSRRLAGSFQLLLKILESVDHESVASKALPDLVPSTTPIAVPKVRPNNRRSLGSSMVHDPSAKTIVTSFRFSRAADCSSMKLNPAAPSPPDAHNFASGVSQLGPDCRRYAGAEHPKFKNVQVGARPRGGKKPMRPEACGASISDVNGIAPEYAPDNL